MNNFIKIFFSNDKSILRIFRINKITKYSLSRKYIEFGENFFLLSIHYLIRHILLVTAYKRFTMRRKSFSVQLLNS